MSEGHSRDISQSIRQRLLNLRSELGENFVLILNRYARERLLYRISISSHRERFILKGATLFVLWDKHPHRMTQDIDLLGIGDTSISELVRVFGEICALPAGEDGLLYPVEEISGEEIREDQVYGGIRVRVTAHLGKMRIPVQIDVGFGDAVTPEPQDVSLPTLLDLPSPRLRVYPPETVVAEKAQAMVVLGMANSRMKDYYDLWVLAQSQEFDGHCLADALSATFRRRQTVIPESIPLGISEEFGTDDIKRVQWRAFVRKLGNDEDDPDLAYVVGVIREFLLLPMQAAREGGSLALEWYPGAGWSSGKGRV